MDLKIEDFGAASFQSVPFCAVDLEGRDGVLELMSSPRALQRATLYLIFSFAVLVTVLIAFIPLMWTSGNPNARLGYTAGVLFFGALLAWFFWAYRKAKHASQQVLIDLNSGTVTHAENRYRRRSVVEVPLEKAALRVHPVILKRTEHILFKGFAAVLWVEQRWFFLACCRTRLEVEECMEAYPEAVRLLCSSDGETLRGGCL